MPVESSLLAFTAAALVVTLAPGPDTFLVIGNTVAGGLRRGLPTVFGIVTGGLFYVAVFGLGVAPLLARSEVLFHAVKLAGAAYLAYLGARSLRRAFGASPPASAPAADGAPVETRGTSAFVQGLLTNALNPKVTVFYLAFLPQFLRPGEAMAARAALLIGIHYAMGLVWLSLVALTVDRLSAWLARGAVRRAFDGVLGVVMLAFGARLALETR
jgi:threonine/homoserine/homoserine lactone efflux protein